MPMVCRLCSEEAQRPTGDEMALEGEGVVNGGMLGEKALGISGRFEALHRSLSPSHHLMRILGAVVLAQTCS